MGRRKKEEKVDLFSDFVIDPNSIICPICHTRFVPTKDNCYYVDNKLICTWKCFFEQVTKWELEKMKLKEGQPQRGRKPKTVVTEEEEYE